MTALGALAIGAGFFAPGSASATTVGKEVTSVSFKLHAETATPGPSASRTAASSVRAGNGPFSALATITCTLRVDNPHHSTHKPETASVDASVSCTARVSSIDLTIYLFDYTHGRGEEGEFVNVGGASRSGTIALSCESGDYQALAETTVYWPPGYSPSPQTWDEESPTVPVSC